MAAGAVVALRGGNLDELLGDVYDVDLEVWTLVEVLHQVAAPRDNHAVAGLETELPLTVRKGAVALVAVCVAQVAGKLAVANAAKAMVNYYVLYVLHLAG